MEKGVLKNFAKFTNTYVVVSFLIKKPEPCNFVEKEALTQVFTMNFTKFLRTPFSQNTSGRLLLSFAFSLFWFFSLHHKTCDCTFEDEKTR